LVLHLVLICHARDDHSRVVGPCERASAVGCADVNGSHNSRSRKIFLGFSHADFDLYEKEDQITAIIAGFIQLQRRSRNAIDPGRFWPTLINIENFRNSSSFIIQSKRR